MQKLVTRELPSSSLRGIPTMGSKRLARHPTVVVWTAMGVTTGLFRTTVIDMCDQAKLACDIE